MWVNINITNKFMTDEHFLLWPICLHPSVPFMRSQSKKYFLHNWAKFQKSQRGWKGRCHMKCGTHITGRKHLSQSVVRRVGRHKQIHRDKGDGGAGEGKWPRGWRKWRWDGWWERCRQLMEMSYFTALMDWFCSYSLSQLKTQPIASSLGTCDRGGQYNSNPKK